MATDSIRETTMIDVPPQKATTLPDVASRGFPGLMCPRCMTANTVTLDLEDLDRCYCTSCEEEFTVVDICGLVECWLRVLRWIELAPRTK